MSGISKYHYEVSKFDTEEELNCLDLKRLINLQKMQLENVIGCLNDSYFDKNDLHNFLKEILITNKILSIKLSIKLNDKKYL